MNILFISQLYPLSDNSRNSFALHYFVKEWVKDHAVQVIRPHLFIENEKISNVKSVVVDEVTINVIKPIWIPILKKCIINKTEILHLISHKPDIIICHLYNSYLTFDFLKAHFNVPFVVGIHKSDALLVKHYFYRFRIKKAISKASTVVFRSLAVKKNFEKFIPTNKNKSFIAYSGLPKNLIKKANYLITKKLDMSGKVKVLTVCRLLKLKQIDKVINALHEFNNKSTNWEFVIVGQGSEEKKLKHLVKRKNLEKQIKFVGQVSRDEVFRYMEESDVFIMPSYNETFGLVFLEAMANGCIVIGAEGWGIDGVVRDGINGFLCDPYSQDSITKKINEVLLMDIQKANIIRKNSLETVANFSNKNKAEEYLSCISSIVW